MPESIADRVTELFVQMFREELKSWEGFGQVFVIWDRFIANEIGLEKATALMNGYRDRHKKELENRQQFLAFTMNLIDSSVSDT